MVFWDCCFLTMCLKRSALSKKSNLISLTYQVCSKLEYFRFFEFELCNLNAEVGRFRLFEWKFTPILTLFGARFCHFGVKKDQIQNSRIWSNLNFGFEIISNRIYNSSEIFYHTYIEFCSWKCNWWCHKYSLEVNGKPYKTFVEQQSKEFD